MGFNNSGEPQTRRRVQRGRYGRPREAATAAAMAGAGCSAEGDCCLEDGGG
jgi:hypothetical protein